jgi:hypothetical protein
MKKFIFSLILTVLVLCSTVPVFAAADISNAKWVARIDATNTGAAANNVAATYSLNTASMITQARCNSSVTDIAMMSNGTSIPVQPGYGSDPWFFYIDSINPGTIKTYFLYSKDVTGGNIVQFPGAAGWTISDDATMEWGSSGSFSCTAFTNNTITGDLMNHGGYPQISFPSSGVVKLSATSGSTTATSAIKPNAAGDLTNITSLVGAATHWQACSDSSDSSYATMTTSSYLVDLFNIPDQTFSGTIANIVFTTRFYDSSYGLAKLAYKIGGTVYYGAERGSTYSAFTSYTDTISTNPSTSLPWTLADVNNLQIGGAIKNTNSQTSAFVEVSIVVNYYSTVSTTVSGIADGLHTYITDISGGLLHLTVDGSTNSTAYAGSISDVSANWTGFSSATTLYVVSANFTKSGAQAASYFGEYPTTMSSILTNGSGTFTGSPKTLTLGQNTITTTAAGTFTLANSFGWKAIAVSGNATITSSPLSCPSAQTRGSSTTTTITSSGAGTRTFYIYVYRVLTDQSVNTNDAVASFRASSSSANVSGSVVSFLPTEYAEASPPSTASTDVITDLSAPIQMYIEGDYSNLPGADAINSFLDDSGTPRALWWFPFIFIGIGIFGMMIFGATKSQGGEGSLLTQCIVCDFLLFLFGIMGPTMLWPGILFWIPATALILSRKHFSYG